MTAMTAARRKVTPKVRRDAAVSAIAKSLVADLMAAQITARRTLLAEFSPKELSMVLAATDAEHGTPYALYRDDPVGFVEDVLGETLWSRQRMILDAVARYKRIAVPAGFGLGKTHISARAVAHFVSTRPVGSALAITTATRMRQVQRQMWPHIRKVQARAGLPGECDQIQWSMPDRNGVKTMVAYGFSAPAGDEAAMQGEHSGAVLLVVDEAGGFDQMLGSSTNNLLTGDARMLAIGNPPSDDEDSWFERLCTIGEDPSQPETVTISIPVTSSPAVTGEDAGPCTDHPDSPPHTLASHMPGQQWIDDTIRDFGEDSAYVTAKVHARFPHGGSSRIIPMSWLELAVQRPDPAGTRWRRLCDLKLASEVATHTVGDGEPIALGVDVAAAGGDELVVARSVGDLFTIEHTSSGADNASAVDVSGKVLAQIRRAELLRQALGTIEPVRVKVDSIGVGWGVVTLLQRWGREGLHGAEVIGINVANTTGRKATESAPMVPARQRDEMWIAGRTLVQPAPVTGEPACRLRVDRHTMRQLGTPSYSTNSSTGMTEVESKKSMKSRGEKSPDRAEAVLLCNYEPRLRRRARLIA